jgi:hypothetical protein
VTCRRGFEALRRSSRSGRGAKSGFHSQLDDDSGRGADLTGDIEAEISSLESEDESSKVYPL